MKIHLSLRFLDVDHLFVLVGLLKGKSCVEIAGFLKISQAAISQRVSGLNDFFAFEVTKKQGRKLVLTKKGEQVAKAAEQSLILLHESLDRARLIDE